MNRRSFFSRLLGAACFAVAQKIMPSCTASVNFVPLPQGYGRKRSGIEFVMAHGKTPSAEVQVWLDEYSDMLQEHIEEMERRRIEVEHYLLPPTV